MKEISVLVKSRPSEPNFRLRFAFFHYGGLNAEIVICDGCKNPISYSLLIFCSVEELAKVLSLPGEFSAKLQKLRAYGTVFHGDSAKNEEAAYIRISIEREAASFVRKDEFVWHRSDS